MVFFRKMNLNLKEEFKKFILYGIGGGLALLINLSSTYILTEKIKIFYLTSAILSYILSLFFNFLFQSFITFKTKQKLFLQRFLIFSFFQLIGLTLYSILIFIFTEKFKIYYLFSIILSSILIYIFNFNCSKFLIFKI